MDHFCLPLLLKCFQQIGSYFPHATLECADLEWLIATGRALLQLPEDVAATALGVGNQPGHDLLPLSSKWVLSSYVASPGRVFFAPARDRGYGVLILPRFDGVGKRGIYYSSKGEQDDQATEDLYARV